MSMTDEIDDSKLTQAYQYWHDCGFDEGYECGYEEGYEAGLDEGKKVGGELDEEAQGS